jgi:hypothetical protein
MLPRLRSAAALLASMALATPAFPQVRARKNAPSPATVSASALPERQRALHALNRLTFGPRPGDAGKVLAKGVDSWIEDQLHPESIDDSALEARLAPFRTLRMPPPQLAAAFPSDGLLRLVMAGKKQIPADPTLRLVYSVEIARLRKQAAKPPVAPAGAAPTPEISPQDQARDIADNLLAMPKAKRLAALAEIPPEQLINFINLLRPEQRDRLNADFAPQEREAVYALNNPSSIVTYELQQARFVERAPVARSHDGLLVQSFQRLSIQGR